MKRIFTGRLHLNDYLDLCKAILLRKQDNVPLLGANGRGLQHRTYAANIILSIPQLQEMESNTFCSIILPIRHI